jgi:hypothetical protein
MHALTAGLAKKYGRTITTKMLVAGHIKPWKDSAPSERLDPRNG